ncbi:MAG: twin-arginine translocation signal domain-containing protein [Mesorhizobium sp.]|uniref:twin-arginine translocation signal domain-containing protein n=1 Tax=Mesorhizobium sp. TaxID=1871066 RepID=UPI00122792AC|nr:MAG: twin-arginine translocation signal domain-containing protein [Mesorhizobium sp.]TJU84146.1 MAG: twin-arginine translocation signal domain-containing protein [Mesorhizobium sp.]
MSFWINRRRFMQATSSAIAAGALSCLTRPASAQSSGELRVTVGSTDQKDLGRRLCWRMVYPWINSIRWTPIASLPA